MSKRLAFKLAFSSAMGAREAIDVFEVSDFPLDFGSAIRAGPSAHVQGERPKAGGGDSVRLLSRRVYRPLRRSTEQMTTDAMENPD
jgi:hypothetical protein